jgi:hypothetical protein
MPRSMFNMGIASSPFQRGQSVGPIFLDMTKEEIERLNYAPLRQTNIPPGWTGSYPYIVKVGQVGEYVVYANGTAQYLNYINGRSDEIVNIR